MFIAGSAKRHYQLRSEERNSTSASPLQNYSAPPNGDGGVLISIYKHVTPNGVKAVNSRTHHQERPRRIAALSWNLAQKVRTYTLKSRSTRRSIFPDPLWKRDVNEMDQELNPPPE